MARYKIILAYDGTDFLGFQRQGNRRTVQAEFEKSLRSLGWDGKTILAAGRTDVGVHATGQVIAFDLSWKHDESKLTTALNARLPDDIAVQSAKVVESNFHPRYQAHARIYAYRIFISPIANPLMERYSWRVWPKPDLALLKEASKALIGLNDYRAFGAPQRKNGCTVRLIFDAAWKCARNELVFSVTGNAFLYHMVRRMVFLQIRIGQGFLSMPSFVKSIACGDQLAGGLAPAKGLCLKEVRYCLSDQEEMILTYAGLKPK